MKLDRRKVTIGLGAVAATGITGTAVITPAMAQSVDKAELMKPGPLGEKILGQETAPVTIVEYASLTCPHCADFHSTTLPDLKAKYIDTGKARLIMREFPLDQLAWAGFMVARCSDPSKYFAVLNVLYQQQKTWAQSQDPATELFKIAKQTGMTKDQFDACLKNEDMAKGIIAVKDKASENFGVQSTPTFFINGEMMRGHQTLAKFEEMMKPYL